MAQSAASLTTSDRPQQTFALLKLPVELRTMIYDLGLQDILDDIAKPAKGKRMKTVDGSPPPLPFLGALAILHTCRELRDEGVDAIRSLAQTRCKKLDEASQLACDEMMETPLEHLTEALAELDRRQYDVFDGLRLRDTLHKVAQNQVLLRLSRLRVGLPWSKLDHGQKLREVTEWSMALTFDDWMSLCPSISEREDVGDVLIELIDTSVEAHGKEH